jgi:hypothetical protein
LRGGQRRHSFGTGDDEKTVIISLEKSKWSTVVSNDRNIGGTFTATTTTTGTLTTNSNTGNAVLSGGQLNITGFSGTVPSQVNGIYTKKNGDDNVVEEYDEYC